jgi:hypothetical protein
MRAVILARDAYPVGDIFRRMTVLGMPTAPHVQPPELRCRVLTMHTPTKTIYLRAAFC